MYIRRKVFSLLQDSETGEERYFSTTDVIYEERDFARVDYEGLTDSEKLELKTQRSKLAKELLKDREYNNNDYLEQINSDSENKWIEKKKAGRTKLNSFDDHKKKTPSRS